MSRSFQEAVLAQPSKSAELRETRQDPETPASPPKKVFVNAGQPPPLKSQWSSIVKQQSKGKEGTAPTLPAQLVNHTTPASPSAGAVASPSSSLAHSIPYTGQQKAGAFANGRQTSPRAAEKDLGTANGFASSSESMLSPGTPPLEAQPAKPDPADRQSQPSQGFTQNTVQSQARKETIRDASPPARPAWKKPESVETSLTNPLSDTQTAWPSLGGTQEPQRKRRGSSAPTTPNSSQTLKPSPPSSESAAVIPLSKVGDGLANTTSGTSQAPSVGEASAISNPASSALDHASVASAPERSAAGASSSSHNAALRNRSNSSGPVGATAPNSIARRRSSDPNSGPSRATGRVRPAPSSGANGPAAGPSSSKAQISNRGNSKAAQNNVVAGHTVSSQPSESSTASSGVRTADSAAAAAAAIHGSKSLEAAPSQGRAHLRSDPNLQGSRSFDSQPGGKQRAQNQQQRQFELAAAQMGTYSAIPRSNGMAGSLNAAPQMFYPPSMYYPQGAFQVQGGQMNPYMTAVAQEQLLSAVATQIEYYFSVGNLCKDVFLRRKMDDDGWIPLAVIASFNRVRALTADIAVILQALHNSQTVEMSPDRLKLRAASNHQNWVLPPAERDQSVHSTATPAAPAFGTFHSSMMPLGGQLRVGSARGGRRRDDSGEVMPRRGSGEGAGTRGQSSGSRAAQSAPASPSGKGQLQGISTNGFRAGHPYSAGKAASEASTPLPQDSLDEGLFQHSEETSASSTAGQSSLDGNHVHHDGQPIASRLSLPDADIQHLLLLVPSAAGKASGIDASAAEGAISGLQLELLSGFEEGKRGSSEAKSASIQTPAGPHFFPVSPRNGAASGDTDTILHSKSAGAVGWLASPSSVSRPSIAPDNDSAATTSDTEYQPWDSIAQGPNATLLQKQAFRIAQYTHLRDVCLQSRGSSASLDALFTFLGSFLRLNDSTVLQHDFEQLAQKEAEDNKRFDGLLRLFHFYGLSLQEHFSDDLYLRFEQLAVKYAEQHHWQQGLEILLAVQHQCGIPQSSKHETPPKGKQQSSAQSGSEPSKPPKIVQVNGGAGLKSKFSEAAEGSSGPSSVNSDQALSVKALAFVPHAGPSGSALPNGELSGSKASAAQPMAESAEPSNDVSLAQLAAFGKAKSLKPAGSVDAIIQSAI